MFTNWKTTSAGIIAIVGAVTGFYFALQSNNLTPEVITGCIGSLLAGIGLIFAKDSNVTGGTKSNE